MNYTEHSYLHSAICNRGRNHRWNDYSDSSVSSSCIIRSYQYEQKNSRTRQQSFNIL